MKMNVSIDESIDFLVEMSENAIYLNTSVSVEPRNVSILNTTYHKGNYKCVECYIIINQIFFLVINQGISISEFKHSRKKNKVKCALAEFNMHRKSLLTSRKSLLYEVVKMYGQKNLVTQKLELD